MNGFKWPGEDLVKSMWASVVDNGIGSLLRPGQIRREGRARTEVKVERMLAIAAAERDIETLRSNPQRLLPGATGIVSSPARLHSGTPESSSREPDEFVAAAVSDVVAERLRKEVNVSKALVHAEEALADDPSPPPQEKPEPDWLFRWRDAAGAVSSDELQHLWGQVLAGEVKAPGSFSLRSIEFLRTISKHEADLIERVSRFVWTDIIYREKEALDERGITFQLLLEMQDLGLISGVEAETITRTLTTNGPDRFYNAILAKDSRIMFVEHTDPTVTLAIPVYKVTAMGAQIFKLSAQPLDLDYMRHVGRKICGDGYSVKLGRYALRDDGMLRLSEMDLLCDGPVAPTPS